MLTSRYYTYLDYLMLTYPKEQAVQVLSDINRHLATIDTLFYPHITDAVLVYINPTHSFEGGNTTLEVNTYYQDNSTFYSLLKQYLASTEFISSGTNHKQASICGCIAVTTEGLEYIKHLNSLKDQFCFWSDVIIRNFTTPIIDTQWHKAMLTPPDKIDVKKRIALNKTLFGDKTHILKVRKKLNILPESTIDFKLNWRKTRKQKKLSTDQIQRLIDTNFKDSLISSTTDIDAIIDIAQKEIIKGNPIYSIETFLPNLAMTYRYAQNGDIAFNNKSSLALPVIIEASKLPRYEIRCHTKTGVVCEVPEKYVYIEGTRKLYRLTM
ncbi:MAG: hypothetical protein MJK11_01985 [Pseudomonadales bacterium]|nr:hypothetical protein [Pseudomonadales bacterium]